MKRICKPRCGSKMVSGFEVPETAKIFQSKSGRNCYLSGIKLIENKAIIRYLDDGSFVDIPWANMKPYL